jgi:hypothetical protein
LDSASICAIVKIMDVAETLFLRTKCTHKVLNWY